MRYYIDIFSPITHESISKTEISITGFREYLRHKARMIHVGDKFICYLTKLSRWCGVLQVLSDFFIDSSELFSYNDPYILRFNVKPICWLSSEFSLPIHEDYIWNSLSFTKQLNKNSTGWTGKVRGSMMPLDFEDGLFLEEILLKQNHIKKRYPIVDSNKKIK